ncbi:ComEA family DNA-binding protein [Microbacterium sp. UBA837]|uniref:ComEA family DNA-binding protein n=1 Tax=Microbacterium sp. UBA837 TaxID=1946956 RepID=UPI0025CD7A1D|nr:helix-hairpin-helix domain-containing protein [Microbacterium sp. UBA837]
MGGLAREDRRRWGVGAVVILALGALAIAVIVGIVRGAGSAQSLAPAPVTVATASTSLYVHVSGAVNAPGLYVLHADARVVDAVAAAGGLAEDAEAAGVNLARPVSDGEQVIVPRVGEAPAAGPAGVTADGRVNLNSADEGALDTLPGVGPAIAGRIIEWREANGRFASVDDLLSVSGIGPKMLESLRDLVTV